MTSEREIAKRWRMMTDCSGRPFYTRDIAAERRAIWVERACMALAWGLALAVAVMICYSLVLAY